MFEVGFDLGLEQIVADPRHDWLSAAFLSIEIVMFPEVAGSLYGTVSVALEVEFGDWLAM